MTGADDAMLVELLGRLFHEHVAIDAGRPTIGVEWDAELWNVAADIGLPWIGVDERSGGSGGTLGDVVALAKESGRHAVGLPLADCAGLAAWLIAEASLALNREVVVPAGLHPHDRVEIDESGNELVVSGVLHHVPYARHARSVAIPVDACDGLRVVVVDIERVQVTPRSNLAGEPRDDLRLDRVTVADGAWGTVDGGRSPSLRRADAVARGALLRVAAIAGALERVSAMSVQYSSERHQFGKPIGSFQAVQHLVVRLAEQSALASMAARLAAAATGPSSRFEIGAAKLVAIDAATAGAALAHQIHGAIGVTIEYPLQQLTRRLWSWRDEYGTARTWGAELGRRLLAGGGSALWPTIVDPAATRQGDT